MSTALRSRAAVLVKALQAQGPSWMLTRIRLRLAGDLGLLQRRTPLISWGDLKLNAVLRARVPTEIAAYADWRRNHMPAFFVASISPLDAPRFIGKSATLDAERILKGELPFFGGWRSLGFPPKWNVNPINDEIAPAAHWSRIDEFGAGDIKYTWEVNRFAWVYFLSRAYACSRDLRYAEAFWQLFENWMEQNPPNRGVNWKCGQETSFRLMALCFGFYAFADSPASTSIRVACMAGAIAAHARRVAAYIQYAVSQHNNHPISEGVALWTTGLLFPELKGAEHWRIKGKQIIEGEVKRQVFGDGAYIQHSANYHRVLLHDLAWAIRLGELNGAPLDPDVYDKLRLATDFLHGITDSQSGFTPNYGPNDGALVLPLSDCAYPDMRPVLQCCHYITNRRLLYPPGPWDEETAWLNGAASLQGERSSQHSVAAELDAHEGGCYTIRTPDSWAMLRAARYQHRPTHADELHVDLWWRGQNILCDAGTYSYNGGAPFVDGFASTRYHNTIEVDGADQMTRVTRFLWADWPSASAERVNSTAAGAKTMRASHDGYSKRGVLHRRTVVRVAEGVWLVVDDLIGSGTHELTLHWLLPDAPFNVLAPGELHFDLEAGRVGIQLFGSTEGQYSLVRGGRRLFADREVDSDPTRGWTSRYYGHKEPALSFMRCSASGLPVRLVTAITLGLTSQVRLSPSLEFAVVEGQRLNFLDLGISPVLPEGIS